MLTIETKELEISDKLKSLDDLDESRKSILGEMIQRTKPKTDIHIQQIKKHQELGRQKEEEMRMRSNYDDKEIGRTIQ